MAVNGEGTPIPTGVVERSRARGRIARSAPRDSVRIHAYGADFDIRPDIAKSVFQVALTTNAVEDVRTYEVYVRTAASSSFNSATVRSIMLRAKSLIGSPTTR